MKKDIYNNILDTVGNTPLVQINRKNNDGRAVFIKMEGLNPGGSMKDRTSNLIISEMLRKKEISPGGTIIESSSGNMAIGLAQACLFHGLDLIVVVDINLNPHTRKLLRAYGAEVVTIYEPHPEGGFLAARLKKVNELLDQVPNSVWSNQYQNPNNPGAYQTTMKEIMQVLDNDLDYLFVATSTCGSLMGCMDYVKAKGLKTKIIAVDAVGSVLFGDKAGKRKIPGHGAGVASHFLNRDNVFDVIHVSDLECVQGCRKLLAQEAILPGGSSGGIFYAYEKYKHRLPQNSRSVLLFADRGERYLDTVYSPEWVKENIEMDQVFKNPSQEKKTTNTKRHYEHVSI
ncbi:2,3-diaminopropionate biosynthesis protein SbnA [Flagellimonas crocea]|uniref:2,3-diaminopropionate biosynthesis protein SbnA n=1 Tax=Flagellimonas crocea TaxID=3067311 RepID=UPI00296F4BA1|nr:2,3-diaminopropionate biosynthesis protein SbnA [Muricauda sp. DH64]